MIVVHNDNRQELRSDRKRINLNGEWEFCYDPEQVGVELGYPTGKVALPERIPLPGCPQRFEFASRPKPKEEADNGLLEMCFLKYPCSADSWYRREFEVPAEFAGKRLWLCIGAMSPSIELWLNGEKIGLSTAIRRCLFFDVTEQARAQNVLVARIAVTELPRLDGRFEAYFYYGFTGITRDIWLEVSEPTHFIDVHVMSEIDPPRALVNYRLSIPAPGMTVTCDIRGKGERAWERYTASKSTAPDTRDELFAADVPDKETVYGLFDLDMPQAALWDVGRPNLYEATLTLSDEQGVVDTVYVTFGLREIKTVGKEIHLNGRPVFLRGGCDDQIYIETISPPADKEYYRRRIRLAMKYGFNYTKSCIEMYTPEYLDAADEEGYLVCQELPLGYSGAYRKQHVYHPTTEFKELWRREVALLTRRDYNHPSLITVAITSEKGHTDDSFEIIHQELPALVRSLNPGVLIFDVTQGNDSSSYTRCGKRGTDLIEDVTAHHTHRAPFLHPLDTPEAARQRKLPWILHEFAWWTSLPDPNIRKKYTEDIPFKLRGVTTFEAVAKAKQQYEELARYVQNSVLLKNALRKEGLELSRQTSGVAGYHFWLIADFLANAPEGVFNEFYEEKGDLTADEFQQFNGDVILLLGQTTTRCFRAGEPERFEVRISNYGNRTLYHPVLCWEVDELGATLFAGESKVEKELCVGKAEPVADFTICMPTQKPVSRVKLKATLYEDGERICENAWNLWFYAEPDCQTPIDSELAFLQNAYPHQADGVIVTAWLTEDILKKLNDGASVVLFSEGCLAEDEDACYQPANFTTNKAYRSPPWNVGTEGNSGTVIYEHPLSDSLAHEGWCDVNWVALIDGIYPLSLEPYTAQIKPIIRAIGHFRTLVNKAYLFDARVGAGKLIATSLRIAEIYKSHIEVRGLVDAMLRYAQSEAQPNNRLTLDQLRNGLNAKHRNAEA